METGRRVEVLLEVISSSFTIVLPKRKTFSKLLPHPSRILLSPILARSIQASHTGPVLERSIWGDADRSSHQLGAYYYNQPRGTKIVRVSNFVAIGGEVLNSCCTSCVC